MAPPDRRPPGAALACAAARGPGRRDDPFDYVREQVRFTSQPIEETDDPTEVGRLFALAEADRTLMFSSDYPHYDFDEPRRAMPRGVDATLRQRVMAGNAQELYGLPATRPAQAAEVGA